MTKIMLVEDDNNLREIYEARLAAEGYDIVSAADGEAALALAGKEKPDMIISDVMMPKISGFEMLDILRNTDSLRNVKIIMLTALGQAEDSERANHLGADRYLVKSQVTLEDIVQTAHELLDDPRLAEPDLPDPPAGAAVLPDADEAAVPAPTAMPSATDLEPEPTVAPAPTPATPAAPEETSPEPAVAPEAAQAPEEPTADIPVAEPPAPAPEPEAAAAPVISIPVMDDAAASVSAADDNSATNDDATDTTDDLDAPVAHDSATADPSVATADNPLLHPVSNLPITPEVTPESPAADNQEDTDETPNYTSPENFNKFQVAPTTPEVDAPADAVLGGGTPGLSSPDVASPDDASTPPDAPAPASSIDTLQHTDAEQTAAIQSQIDAFISQQETVPAAGSEPDPEPANDTPTVPLPAPTGETPGTSSVSPNLSMMNPFASKPRQADTLEPVAEELDTYASPVISADNADRPDNSVETQDQALVSAAADDLASSSGTVVSPTSTPANNGSADTSSNDSGASTPSAPKKIISPVDNNSPSIHQLLELEEAKAAAKQAQQATTPVQSPDPKPHVDALKPTASVDTTPPSSADNQNEDPSNIAL